MPTFLTDLTGLGAVLSGIAALIAAIYAKTAAKEMKPNHGSSMRDLMDSMNDRIKAMGYRQGELHDHVQNALEDHRRIWQHIEKLEN
ncbi:flagellar motor protein [Mobiluncus mulieris]|uniref:Flagellar motor protein n=2 Tax=Mobiluncus mulieris TaxID=2052 RepID=A0A378PGC3_9ACTO|nr:putative peptidoglycan binding domain-containing protein [Mobiluncus mulieris]EFM46478.1 hypothetical protein HMPREF0580_1025 [Mobiluncus mulieris ATCC 35239]MCU9970485.1 flagellar motor protein [Mobiluncus mulieris]MCU9993190.1 flagellar motor protein [Mobiluncus mulieris]MCU9995969.1 flagellar motor protein [Mobiluncus mulieris]MCV0013360.1 flagellar motor protein [Mobiluncus mulieris]